MAKKKHIKKHGHRKRHKVYNRHEPPMIGYSYNRLADVPIAVDLHYINNRSKDFERLEALKRVADRESMRKVLSIEAAYYKGHRAAVADELSAWKDELVPKIKTDRTPTTGGQGDAVRPHQVRGGQRTPPPSPVRTTTAEFHGAVTGLRTNLERDRAHRLGRVRSAMPVDLTSTGRLRRVISRSEQ